MVSLPEQWHLTFIWQCDEQRPCTACSNHGVPCSLSPSVDDEVIMHPAAKLDGGHGGTLDPVQGPDTSPSSRLGATSSSSTASPAMPEDRMYLSAGLQVPFLRFRAPSLGTVEQLVTQDSFDCGSNPMLDLELMHHYMQAPCKAFLHISPEARERHVKPYFRDVVPRLAVSHPFLMHQLLALAGFQLIDYQSSDGAQMVGHLQRAQYHQQRALGGIRREVCRDINSDNALPLFIASTFLIPTTWASRRHVPPEDGLIGGNSPLDNLLSMVGLYRGVSAIQRAAGQTLRRDLAVEVFGGKASIPPDAVGACKTFYGNHIAELEQKITMAAGLDEHTRQVALRGVKTLLNFEDALDLHVPGIISLLDFHLLYRLYFAAEDEFLQLLRLREPVVLVVFLHYCIALQRAERWCWALKGWCARIVDEVQRELQASPWLEAAQWPLEEISIRPLAT